MSFEELTARERAIAFALAAAPEYPQQIGYRLRNSNGHLGFRGPGKVSLNKLVRLGIAEKTGNRWDIRYRRGPRWSALNARLGEAQAREELANLTLHEEVEAIFRDCLPRPKQTRPTNIIPFPPR